MDAVSFVPLPFFWAAAALAVWQLAAFAAAPACWRKSAVKTGAVAALAAGLSLARPEGAGAVILLGLTLGAVGDYCLSRPGTAAFLAGMAAFAGGHLAYAAAFWTLGRGGPDPLAAVALTAVAAAALIWLAPRAPGLAVPVRAYIGIIWGMALVALRVEDPRLLAGALLFMASDFVLAIEMFVLRDGALRQAARRAVWALYWPAQALIAWAAVTPRPLS